MSIGGASDGLNRLATEVHNGLEEVRKSERRMNTNLEHLVDDFRNRRFDGILSAVCILFSVFRADRPQPPALSLLLELYCHTPSPLYVH